MFPLVKHEKVLRVRIPESQPHLNLMAALNHISKAILTFEDISRPRVRSHTTT